jgi:hypothetical protein
MPDLKIAVATNGPVPDNQCALKDAILFAAQSDAEFTAEDVVGFAEAFYAFLVNPQAQAMQAAQAQQPTVVQPTPLDSTLTVDGQAVAHPTPPTPAVDLASQPDLANPPA